MKARLPNAWEIEGSAEEFAKLLGMNSNQSQESVSKLQEHDSPDEIPQDQKPVPKQQRRGRDARPWTEADIDKLRELCRGKLSLNAIAKSLKRSWNNVRDKIKKLGIDYNQSHNAARSKASRKPAPVKKQSPTLTQVFEEKIKSLKQTNRSSVPASHTIAERKATVEEEKIRWTSEMLDTLDAEALIDSSPAEIAIVLEISEKAVRAKLEERAKEKAEIPDISNHKSQIDFRNMPPELKVVRAR